MIDETVLGGAVALLKEELDEAVSVHALRSGPAAERMAASWPHVQRKVSELLSPGPEEAAERLDWLWEHVDYDVDEWAQVAQVMVAEAKAIAPALIRCRVVWPDGTVGQHAAEYLESVVSGKRRRR